MVDDRVFHSPGMSDRVMQVLTMCRMTPPIADNPVLNIQIHTSSAPLALSSAYEKKHAAEFLQRDRSRSKAASTDTGKPRLQVGGRVLGLGLNFGGDQGAHRNKNKKEFRSSANWSG